MLKMFTSFHVLSKLLSETRGQLC